MRDRREFPAKIRAAAFERAAGCCENCNAPLEARYALSAARLARPRYCSKECLAVAQARRAADRVEERFWSRVAVVEGGCWTWTGRCDPRGYGRFDTGGQPTLAHRFAYTATTRQPIEGLAVCHTCDNPPCCNPDHLFAAPQAANVADMDAKQRRRSATRRGEASNKAKLTEDQARAIFSSGESARVLASRYGISTTAVRLIKTGKNWGHVTGAPHVPS